MKARVIQTKFWTDEFVADLKPLEKLIFVYLLTNERVNLIHCYECPDRQIVFDTGIAKDALEGAKQRLEASRKVAFFQGWVHLLNGNRYQRYEGEKNEEARKKLEQEMSASIFSWYKEKSDTPIDWVSTGYRGGIDTPHNHNHNHNHKIILVNRPLGPHMCNL